MSRTPVMWIDEQVTYKDSRHPWHTPEAIAGEGLGALLNRIVSQLDNPATLLLGGELPKAFGFGGNRPPRAGARQHGTALKDAAAAGWTIQTMRPWMTAVSELGHRVHIGVMPWVNASTFALHGTDAQTMVHRLEVWRELLGVPYYGEHAGLTGIAMMRDNPRIVRGAKPYWSPDWSRIEPANVTTEGPDRWTAPGTHESKFEHGYDVTTQYLSAAGNAILAVNALGFTGTPPEIERYNAPGYYQITVPHWVLGDRMPHPCGQYTADEKVWVTHPTMDLLFELADTYGIISLPEVHAAWTSTGKRVLREWSATIANAVQYANKGPDSLMFDAVKQVYKRSIGMLEVPTSRVYRPDWAAAIKATARVNLWRRAHAEGIASDRWPVQIEADTVWYPSNEAHGQENWPSTFQRGDGATGGTFMLKGSRTPRVQRTHAK